MSSVRSAFRDLLLASRNAASGRLSQVYSDLKFRAFTPIAPDYEGEVGRIAIISGVFCKTPPVGYGGVERSIYHQARDLARRGWDVHLWGDFQELSTGLYEGITLHQGIDSEGLEVASVNPDIVYQAYPSALRTKRLRRRNSRLIISEFNALESLPPLSHGVHVRCFNQLFWKIARDEGYPPERLINVPLYQGAETEYRPSIPREDWLLWIGRADHCKALEEAFYFSRLTGIPLKFACGMPDLRGDWYARALWRLMPKTVNYLGEVGPDQKRGLFSRCRALLYTCEPSLKEAFGLIFLEALASGTPVLAMDHHPGSTQSWLFPGPPFGLRATRIEDLADLYQAQSQELLPELVAERYAEIYGQQRIEKSLDTELRRLLHECRSRA